MEEYRRLIRKFVITGVLVGVVFISGAIGYWILEGWPFLDCMLESAITISTVGYGIPDDIKPATKVFSMLLIFAGISVVLYGISALTQFIVEGEINKYLQARRRLKMIEKLRNHHIIVGAGKTGKHIISEFIKRNNPFVVIDRDESNIKKLEEFFDKEFLYIVGDATEEDILLQAGIDRAKSLITTLPDDTKNVFVVLSARTLNPALNVISRASDIETMRKLLYAGATSVVATAELTGIRMAMMATNPGLISFLDVVTFSGEESLRLEEFVVKKNSYLANKKLSEIKLPQSHNLIVISIRKRGSHIFNPTGDTVVEVGDRLVVLGKKKDIEEFSRFLESEAIQGQSQVT